MSISDLLTKTTSDATLIWSAAGIVIQIIQLIFLIFSATVVFGQIRQFRRDSIESKVAGLRTALDILDTNSVRSVTKELVNGRPVGGREWEDVLERINLVGLLVLEGYTLPSLLLKLKSKELSAVGRHLLTLDNIQSLSEQFPYAIQLTKQALKENR